MVGTTRRAAANAEAPVVAPGANPDPASIVIRMMEPMLAAMSKAIVEAMTTGATITATAASAAATSAAAAATAAVALPSTKPISSSIDPFDSLSTDMDSKEEKALWYAITAMTRDWPKRGVSCTVQNAEKFQDLYRDKVTSYGLDRSMEIPTTGTGAIESAPKTSGGNAYAHANLGTFLNFLDKVHQVKLEEIRAFEGWYCSSSGSSLAISADMKIEPLDPNAAGNQELVSIMRLT